MPGCSALLPHTRRACRLDLDQFLAANGIQPDDWDVLADIRPSTSPPGGSSSPLLVRPTAPSAAS
jgi:hypothetical protein